MAEFQKKDGMNYAPKSISRQVVNRGEFVFAVTALDHGHIYGMCNGLLEAGAVCKAVYDPDADKLAAFINKFPDVKAAESLEQLLEDQEIQLIAAAAVPAKRCELGIRVMNAGKDYFTDKAPLTTLEQLDAAKAAVEKTGRKYMVYYSERVHVEAAVLAGQLVADGEIGRVVNVTGMGPHRLSAASRPPWFFNKKYYGGILCDIGSHQIEQFLYFTGAQDAVISSARLANFNHPRYPDFDDFGDASLTGDNGATNYFRVDWLTPDGLGTWGDGRLFLLGTNGYIELRKYIDIARQAEGDQLYIVTNQNERHISAAGTVGYPFFGQLILDCLNRTELAMTQQHAFKAAELCVRAQLEAERCRENNRIPSDKRS